MVIIYEDFIQRFDQTMDDIFGSLSLKPVDLSRYKSTRINVAGNPTNRLSQILSHFIYQPHTVKSLIKELILRSWRARWKDNLAWLFFEPEPMPADNRKKLVGI